MDKNSQGSSSNASFCSTHLDLVLYTVDGDQLNVNQ